MYSILNSAEDRCNTHFIALIMSSSGLRSRVWHEAEAHSEANGVRLPVLDSFRNLGRIWRRHIAKLGDSKIENKNLAVPI